MTSPVDNHPPNHTFAWIKLDRPWKISLLATAAATLITVLATVIFFNGENLIIGLAISVPTASMVSYMNSRRGLRYTNLLAETNHELSQVNQDLDSFTQMVSHDLKNPLTVIKGYAAQVHMQYDNLPDERKRFYIEHINDNADKMVDIIDALLLLARVRKENVTVQPLAMDDIVQQALDQVQLLIEEHQPEIEHPEQWPIAIGYAPWIEAVWTNYLSNAIKYGGIPPKIQLGADQQAEHVRFWIRDNGQGLSPTEQANLFAEFNNLPQKIKGHGLGLSIVRRAVEQLGGEVGVESQPEQGSTFFFTLPTLH